MARLSFFIFISDLYIIYIGNKLWKGRTAVREFTIYDPQEYGMSGSPAYDEAYVILHDENLGKSYLAYVYTSDFDSPPEIDIDTMQEITGDLELKEPVMKNVFMQRNGEIVLKEYGRDFILSDQQNELLARPSVINTESGRYVTERNDGGAVLFSKDLTLEGIRPEKLDMRAFSEAVRKKNPKLTEMTHERYGNKYPYFPNAKYYEETNEMIVFVTRAQIQEIEDMTLTGKAPLYSNIFTGEKWDINNVSAVCVVDEKTYDVWIMNPALLKEWKDKDPRYNEEKER